jgi:hypothetical protein
MESRKIRSNRAYEGAESFRNFFCCPSIGDRRTTSILQTSSTAPTRRCYTHALLERTLERSL